MIVGRIGINAEALPGLIGLSVNMGGKIHFIGVLIAPHDADMPAKSEDR